MRQWIIFSVLLSTAFPALAFGDVDFSACFVLSGQDHVEIPQYNEFRMKALGFNRTEAEVTQQCRDLIEFRVESAVLNAPVTLGNPEDRDCTLSTQWPELCGDGWGLVIDGGEQVTDLDVTVIQDGQCALNLTSDHIQIKNINFVARIEQINAGQVICANAPGIDYSQSTFNGFAPLEPAYFLWTSVVNGGPTVNSKSVKLGWNSLHPRSDFEYVIERAPKNSSNQCQAFSRVGSVNGTSIQFLDPQVASGVGYCYRVQAWRGVMHGPVSQVVQVQVPASSVNPGTVGTVKSNTTLISNPTASPSPRATLSNIRKWTEEDLEKMRRDRLRNPESQPH